MPELKPWRQTGTQRVADAKIFTLHRDRAVSPRTGEERTFTRIDSPDWVNVVPVTTAGEVVLVRQWRHGVKGFTLEIPGGLVDPGETPADAATREVREETGYEGADGRLIGAVTPNPAIMNNRCHTVLVRNVQRVGPQALESNEEISVRLEPRCHIPELVREGRIHHALVVAAFHHLSLMEGA